MKTQNSDRMRSIYRTGSTLLLAGCLWFSAAPFSAAQEPSGAAQASRTDADIQADVTSALARDPSLQSQKITASTANGQITLGGTVETNAQRQQAETIAANVQGVSGILNNIKVTNPNSPIPTPAPAAADNSGVANPEVAGQVTDTGDGSASAAPSNGTQTNGTQANGSQMPPPPPPDQGYSRQAPLPPSSGARAPYQPQQGGYYPPPQTGYYQGPPPQQPSGPVTVPAGTLLRVRLNEPLDTAKVKSGAVFEATAATDVYQGGVLAIPRGAVLQGQVVEAKNNSGGLGGSAVLQLKLTNINLDGKIYPLATDIWSNKGPNKAGYTAGNTAGGALLGALIGGIAGRGAGAALGAGIGATAGLAASAATNGPRVYLPPEALVDFHLTAPATVQPVSWQEAQRLSNNVPQQPQLVRRPVVYGPPPGYYYGYPYPYPYYGRYYGW